MVRHLGHALGRTAPLVVVDIDRRVAGRHHADQMKLPAHLLALFRLQIGRIANAELPGRGDHLFAIDLQHLGPTQRRHQRHRDDQG